jgi:hypothetical protein
MPHLPCLCIFSFASLLFSGNDKPSRMLRDLCEHLVDIDGATLKVSEAAQLVEGLPTSTAALMQLLQNCSCLNVQVSACRKGCAVAVCHAAAILSSGCPAGSSSSMFCMLRRLGTC